MAESIDRITLQRLLAEDGIQVVDVLPAPQYEQSHIPGAVSIPLKTLNEETTSVLDKAKPVAVYCHDGL